MKAVFKRIAAWALAVVTTTVLGTVLQTQNLIARLDGIGAPSALSERLSMSAYDLVHLAPLYGLFIGIGLLIAFLAGGVVFRLAKTGRTVVYIVAGAVAMLVMLVAMERVFFGVQAIAGARSFAGLMLQVACGALGGFIFATLSGAKMSQPGPLD